MSTHGPLVIAHRGDSYRHRENTVPAILAGWALGADLVEIDVRRTRDGRPVILHDPTLERLWGQDVAVGDLTLAEIQDAHEAIPGFDQVMALSAAAGRGLMVDLPEAAAADLAGETVDRHHGFELSVFAGVVDGLLTVRRRWPQARIALSWGSPQPPDAALLDELKPEFFNPWWPLVDAALVERMRERGCGISTWTVDAPSNIARLLELGVDAVISNRPAQALAVRDHVRAQRKVLA
ncbi:MAG TPA: glycerophosphodiester phosphodiesterase [Mycobacteriales bacterium]|jgi:glycerophosphoryl diester phosphodiesterase|nr:glycerophosphodiester phosphodiesterase [Mycobacteriales bacterium]